MSARLLNSALLCVAAAAVASQQTHSGGTLPNMVSEPPLSMQAFWAMVSLAVVGTLGQFVFAGAEIGLYSVNRVRLRVRSSRTERPDGAARVLAAEVARLPVVLPALLIGYNLAGGMGSYGMTSILVDAGLTKWPLLAFNLVVMTPVMFIVADMLPKELFRADADRLMYALARPLRVWRLLLTLTGVLPVVQWLSALLARLLVGTQGKGDGGGWGGIGGEPVETEIEQTRAHIHALLKEGANHGVMSEAQLTLVDRAFGLRESDVSDEMIPWSRCRVIQRSWDHERVLAFIRQHPFSRFPVADGARLVGTVEHADLCLTDGRPIDQLVRPAVRLAAGIPVRDAMRTLAAQDQRMGVVVEGGRPIGLVTMKDLVEPLTGELKAW